MARGDTLRTNTGGSGWLATLLHRTGRDWGATAQDKKGQYSRDQITS